MKKLLLAFILSLSLFSSRAQNGGQASENESIKLSLGSVTSDWKQIIIVTNKQNCTVDIKFQHNGETSIKRFPAFSSDTFQITLPDCSVKAKPLDNCGGANMGWLEWNVCAALPIKFDYIKAKKITKNVYELEFKVSSSDNEDHFNVQLSKDGLNYKTITVVLPDRIETNKVYKVKINL